MNETKIETNETIMTLTIGDALQLDAAEPTLLGTTLRASRSLALPALLGKLTPTPHPDY
jgi:hypothetical protein